MAEPIGRSAGRFVDLQALVAWLELAPAGTTIGAGDLLGILAPMSTSADGCSSQVPAPPAATGLPQTWRERIWTVPAETRLGVAEVVEAIGRPKSFVYRHTSAKSGLTLIPHRKMDGELVFVAGEVRTWLRDQEEVIAAGRVDRGPLRLEAGGR